MKNTPPHVFCCLFYWKNAKKIVICLNIVRTCTYYARRAITRPLAKKCISSRLVPFGLAHSLYKVRPVYSFCLLELILIAKACLLKDWGALLYCFYLGFSSFTSFRCFPNTYARFYTTAGWKQHNDDMKTFSI